MTEQTTDESQTYEKQLCQSSGRREYEEDYFLDSLRESERAGKRCS